MRFLPVYQIILKDDRERIFLLKEDGLLDRQIMRVIGLEINVKHGYLPFTEKDILNLFVKANKKIEGSDVMYLLKYCEDAKKNFIEISI